ncbi:MAG: hypothetical protein JNL71_10125 [Rhodospirillales bacterium]|nr:hypothetical protein [Rhodospirillales bacterium]
MPSAHAQISPLDDPTGFWLVVESGPPVNQGLASIPLLGLAVRSQIGNPRAIWEIRREGERYTIDIQTRAIQFAGLALSEGAFRGEIADPNSTGGRIALDIRIADGRLKGKLAFPTHTFELDGRPPESVEALRQAYAATNARLSELDGPYVVPEIERLRQENIVLIERIQRVEGELRQRGQTAAVRPPQPDATATPRISVRGLTGDLAATRATALRAAPDGAAPIVAPVATGQILIRLAEAPAAGWLLVADARGIVGYVQAAQTGPVAAAPAARAAREIAISFPAWDPGRAGRRMTVADPGFVSLVGRVRGDAALRDVRIGDGQTVFNPDGSFTSVLPVPREGRKVRIEAVYASGPPTILEFEIGVGK